MASGRFISVSVAEDVRLNTLSVEAQMMYLMTIPHLDRDGIINGNPSILRGRVCPLREDFIDKMPAIINEWVQSGLVVRYVAGDDTALWFKGFAKNNPLTHYHREKASKFSPPPGYVQSEKGLVPVAENKIPVMSGNSPEPSGNSPREVEVEVDDDIDRSDGASVGESTTPNTPILRDRVHDRLQLEWMTVNITQLENHEALANRYGFEAWKAGFEACKRGQRSSHAYVEKAIISAIDRNPSLDKPKPPKAKELYYYTDPVTGIRREVLM